MRSDKFPAEIRLAVALIVSTGRIARPTSNHEPNRPSASTAPPAATSQKVKRCMAIKSALMVRLEAVMMTATPLLAPRTVARRRTSRTISKWGTAWTLAKGRATADRGAESRDSTLQFLRP
jgi:hypothetical protein